MSLFDGEPEGARGTLRSAPLAERMRPRSLEEYSGQEHLLGPGKPLRVQIERDGPDSTQSGSMILWGPPGVGKTTLAKIIAETTRANFIEFSAVMSGIKEIKQVMSAAAQASAMHSQTILFVDEIHRFNKAQQDAFLPYVERGAIRLIGATTENPSFEIISALLSRCRVYVLQPLSEERITSLLRRGKFKRNGVHIAVRQRCNVCRSSAHGYLRIQFRLRFVVVWNFVGDDRNVAIVFRRNYNSAIGTTTAGHLKILKCTIHLRRMWQRSRKWLAAFNARGAPHHLLHALCGRYPRATSLAPPRRAGDGHFHIKVARGGHCVI